MEHGLTGTGRTVREWAAPELEARSLGGDADDHMGRAGLLHGGKRCGTQLC
jgi:hypothetical protein